LRERPSAPLGDGYVKIPPDLVVEILEPVERGAEIQQKVREYLAFGCRMVWTIDL